MEHGFEYRQVKYYFAGDMNMMSNNSSRGDRGKASDKGNRRMIQQSKEETQRNKGSKYDGVQSPLKFT